MKYFKESEFTMGGVPCFDKMNKTLLLMLDTLRERVGRPCIINSSYRTKEYCLKKGIKYIPTSQHLKAKAVDVSLKGFNGNDRYKIVKEAIDIGFTGIGLYSNESGNFIHLDVRKGEPVMWVE